MASSEKVSSEKELLSRLQITGPISDATPICVLVEIADAHGITDTHGVEVVSEMLSTLGGTNAVVELIYTTPVHELVRFQIDWPMIARFVNMHLNWPQSKLVSAYNFLTTFKNPVDPLNFISVDFEIGLQSPESLHSVNACVLYKICLYHNLHVTRYTTLEQMGWIVKMLRTPSLSLLRRAETLIKKATREELLNILLVSKYEIEDSQLVQRHTVDLEVSLPPPKSSYEILQKLHQTLHDIPTLQAKINPETTNGAIALSALNFKIDISRASQPLQEYQILKINGRANYVPQDPWLHKWSRLNPSLLDLTTTFNPIFPPEYYDATHLNFMIHFEGYEPFDTRNSTPYELMQVAYVSETFYLGEIPGLKSTTTPFLLDPIESVPYGELLCYGSMESATPLSLEELQDLFEANQNFTNPFHLNTLFSKVVIQKLKNILASGVGSQPQRLVTPLTQTRRQELLSLILRIEILMKNSDVPTQELLIIYKKSTPKVKEMIIDVLNQ